MAWDLGLVYLEMSLWTEFKMVELECGLNLEWEG
jgi:hypothetical protein